MKIGTKGPEVFVPPEDGTVLPNGMTFTKPQPDYEGGALPQGATFTPTVDHRSVIDEVARRTAKGGAMSPLDALGVVLPREQIDKSLSIPGHAASMAQWSQAYERLLRSGGAPRAMAGLNMATRNLSNTVGVPFTLADFMKGAT